MENEVEKKDIERFDKIVWTRGQQGKLGFEITITGDFNKDLQEKSIKVLDWADSVRAEKMIFKQLKDDTKEELLNE